MHPTTIIMLKHMLLSSMVSVLIFLMVEVAFAQLLTQTLLTAIDGKSALTTIIFLGFVLASVVNIITGAFTSEDIPLRIVAYASLIALLSNLALWVGVSYAFILTNFPDILQTADSGSFFLDLIWRAFYLLAAIPQAVAVFAIYGLNNVSAFWLATLGSYSVIYAIILYSFFKPRKVAGK